MEGRGLVPPPFFSVDDTSSRVDRPRRDRHGDATSTRDDIARRLDELIAEGQRWLQTGDQYYAHSGVVGWLTSGAHLVGTAAGCRGPYHNQANGLASAPGRERTYKSTVEKMLGVLTSLKADFERGFLRSIEHVVVAETFDQFLEHADDYCRANRKTEASVLVSAVFEDAVRRLADKHQLARDKKMEPLIDDLVRADVIPPVTARRFKTAAGLRNKATHADWDAFSLEDVQEAVRTTRQVVELVNG